MEATNEKTEFIQKENAPQDHQQPDEPRELHKEFKQRREKEQKGKKETRIFFRIWFGLNKREIIKTAIGSFAAAFAGISKPQ